MWTREYFKKDFTISVCWKVNEEASLLTMNSAFIARRG
jgi:hypothetical protein